MSPFLVCLLGTVAFACAIKDPLDFDVETCVKVFYFKENSYNIYCLNYLDNQETLGIVTDHNDTIIFKKNPDLIDESKICVRVHTLRDIKKHCIGTVPSICLTTNEDPRKDVAKTAETVPCKEIQVEEMQMSCIGFKNNYFALVFYCEPVMSYLRRTVFYVPDNKPPKRE